MIAEPLLPLARPVDGLKFLPGNPRRGDVAACKRSLQRFGQRKPIVVREDGTVEAGNTTLRAALELGWSEIAVVAFGDDDATAKAFALADNRTSELGSFDVEALRAMAVEVDAADPELLLAASYDLDELLGKREGKNDPDDVPEPPAEPVTQPGDVWALGPHRVVCGDCRDFGTVERLLDGARVNVAFTSPPYASQRAYDESSGFRPVPPDEYVDWFEDVQANVRAHLEADGSWFVNIKASADGLDTYLYVHDLVIAHVRRWGWHYATEFCWERNGVPKNVTKRFKNQFEPIYQFAAGPWKMRPDAVRHWSENVPVAGGPGVGNTSGAGAQGGNGAMFGKRKRKGGTSKLMASVQGTNTAPGEFIAAGMAYPGNRLPTFTGTHEATGHTAAYPAGLPGWFIKAYTDPGDVVFDPFMGSGSTLIAAYQERRTAYGCEISPAYCDVICARFEQHTGVRPKLVTP